MYEGKTKFTRKQIIFVVDVMISSYTEMVISSCAARHEDGSRDEAYKKESEHYTHSNSLWQLGCNLSIFYAQLTDGGLGEGDALAINNLGDTLKKWTEKFITGEIGIISSNGVSKYNVPDTKKLAEEWVAEAFELTEYSFSRSG